MTRFACTIVSCALTMACGGRAADMPVQDPSDAEGAGGNPVAASITQAIDLMSQGDIAAAEAILVEVARSTPEGWSFCTEDGEAITCAFWNMEQFMVYALWWNALHPDDQREIVWAHGAYSQAWYLLGFIAVEKNDAEGAIAALNVALALEPDSPDILCELATVLGALGEIDEALALYEAALTERPWASGPALARALRGKGMLLIEKGLLDEAEAALVKSLEHEPGNALAIQELEYIEHLRQGGASVPLGPPVAQ